MFSSFVLVDVCLLQVIHLWYLVASAWSQLQEANELIPPSAIRLDMCGANEQAEQLEHHDLVHGRTYSLRISSKLTCAPREWRNQPLRPRILPPTC